MRPKKIYLNNNDIERVRHFTTFDVTASDKAKEGFTEYTDLSQVRHPNTEIDLLTEEIQKVRQDVQDIKSTLSNADSPNQEEDKMQKVVGAISNDVKAIYYEMTKFSKAYHV